MIYTIAVVKEVVHRTEIEGNTLREVLRKIYLDDDVEWVWEAPDDRDVDYVLPSAVIGVTHTTMKQDRELLKEAKKDLEGNPRLIRSPEREPGAVPFFILSTTRWLDLLMTIKRKRLDHKVHGRGWIQRRVSCQV